VRTSRQRFLLSALATAAVLLTGTACATSATAAATVGDQSIPEQTIFDRTASVSDQLQQAGNPAPSELDMAALNRTQTAAAIRSTLWETAAADHDVVITDAQVNAAMSGQASGVSPSTVTQQGVVEQLFRDLLSLQGVLGAAGAQGVPVTDVTVRIDGAGVATRDEAVALRSQVLADPDGAAALLAGTANPIRSTEVNLLSTPTDAQTGIFVTEPGGVLLYPQNGQFLVVRVLDRKESPATLTAAQVQSQSIATQFDLGALALQPYAEGVVVNPRIGAWDPLALQVVPGGNGL
jgi:hypothetical protein